MAIIAAHDYRDGRVVGEPLDEDEVQEAQAPPPDAFAWVGLFDPAPEEMTVCARRFRLHPLSVKDALHAQQIPKLEFFGDQLFVVAATAQMEGGRVTYGETAFFVGRNHIVTVCHGSDQGHGALRAKLEAWPKLLAQGVGYVFHALLDMIAENYFPVIDAVSESVQRFEQRALDAALTSGDMRDIFHLRRDLLLLQRMLIPMEDVCARLASLDLPGIDREDQPYFRDVLNRIRRVSSLASLQREMLDSVMQTSTLVEAQRQSDFARKVASSAAIFVAPAVMAGIYGMNYANRPGSHSEYVLLSALGSISIICVVLFLRFRRSGWL